MRAQRIASWIGLGLVLLAACSDDDARKQKEQGADAQSRPQLLTASAPSMHYVNLSFSAPVGSAGSEASSYVIRDKSGALLPVTGAAVSGGGTQVTLTTAAQQPTEYELLLAMNLGIGSAGFTGSIEGEPFLESALSLSDTSLQLTFSERLDRQFAQNAASYRLLDPDTDQDVDIEITAAQLKDDLRTVVLTTSAQENRLYTVQVTNVKARFSCADGDVAPLGSQTAGSVCAQALRPVTTEGAQARLDIVARTAVDRMQPTNPTAPGNVGTVQTSNSGAGVGTATCSGNPCASSTGSSANEELTLRFDVPTRADTLVLDVNGLRNADVVVFLSSALAPGFDYTIQAAEVKAVTIGNGAAIHFNRLTTLPADLMIDQVRVRATAGSTCLASVCVSDGRIVDPTRSAANFYGIPTVDNTAPRVLSARSTSATSVLVTFSEPLDSEAADPTHFSIGPNLGVTGAVQTEYQTQMLLTTTRQVAGTEYTVTVEDVRDRARNAIDPTARTATFRGISRELYLQTAIARSATEVLLTFSEPMSEESLEDIANYAISDPDDDQDIDIRITGATASADGKTVVLTTTAQQNVEYEITATNIRARSDDFYIDPARNSAVFRGIPPADVDRPIVVSAVSASDTTVLVTFSEPLRVESAAAANFSVTPNLAVLGAELAKQENQILLTTGVQRADLVYTLAVANVRDKAGNPIADAPGNTATFVFVGGPETSGAGAAPRVVGASSTSNTTVVVTFSKAMSDDAILAVNYGIVQDNVNSEVGVLNVVSARFLGTDRTAVELTTRSQNEVTYTVAVTNVRDLSGNQLAAREVSAGVLVDPRRATFAGTPWTCDPAVCVEGCHPSICSAPDPDGDGLSDSDEQRGWVVTITAVNGTVTTRQVTSSPDAADSDGDGLDDRLERLIGSDPRDVDTDDDLLDDYEEYNILYSDPTSQDSDRDGADDYLEVEFYKTNVLIADSDGDGFDDSDELYSVHRNPKVADLPEHAFVIGNVRLQLDQRFTYVDAKGNAQSQTISTSSALQEDSSSTTSDLNQTVGHWLLGAEFGIDTCQSDCNEAKLDTFLNRLHLLAHVEGGQEYTTSHTSESQRATSRAFADALERGSELSTSSEVAREVVGARISVDATFRNPSSLAITLRNLELRAYTTDPNDPERMVPFATLVPESTLRTGQEMALNVGPGQSRGPIVFVNDDVFPHSIEDLMRSPRGVVFSLANYDLETADGRNFASGLQSVRERTAGIRIDKGDGQAEQLRVITAGVLNRSRDDFRCAEAGNRAGYLCSVDEDCECTADDGAGCVDSGPCEGGKIVGGFSEFDGVSGPTGLPLDFVLQSTLGLRRARPAQLIAGGIFDAMNDEFDASPVAAVAVGDDVQVIAPGAPAAPGAVVVAPGHDGVLQTRAAGRDYASEGMRLLAGANGLPDSFLHNDAPLLDRDAIGDDVQLVSDDEDSAPVAPGTVILAAGPNGVIDTPIAGDDELVGPDGLRAGPNTNVDTFARGDDVQLVPVGTRGVPEETVVISGGKNGVLDTLPLGDDLPDVVSGYEVSRTCSVDTPSRILRGPNGLAESKAEDGVCVEAYAPHYFGEECSVNDDCGRNQANNRTGRCAGDRQVTSGDVVVRPDVGATYLDSVPAGDDLFVGPGIPCTVDADCSADGESGTCNGVQQVVRVEERRQGQYRRVWALLLPDDTQIQTDFEAITVRPGDEISLAFVQDIDRDGLTAQTEFLFGSSDFNKDTDDDELSDFAEVRVGWDVGVVGQPLRRSLPDPRRKDSDFDGLTDKEELDFRSLHCACDARGPKSLYGSGSLLRSATVGATEQAQPCNADSDCILPGGALRPGSCKDATQCTLDTTTGQWSCPACSADVTLYRTDARRSDTDGDSVSDDAEVFGYLTGAGIVDPRRRAGTATQYLVQAGSDRDADTLACPQNYCIEDAAKPAAQRKHCVDDGDCVGRACIHPVACDNVQVVAVGTSGLDPRTVVAIVADNAARPGDSLIDASAVEPLSQSLLAGDDVLIAGREQSVIDRTSTPEVCEDRTDFAFCSAIKPGADGALSSIAGGNDALILGGTGQRIETTDPLSPDTDRDFYSDGFERNLGSSPRHAGDASFAGDLDQDGLTDSLERLGTRVPIVVLAPSPLDPTTNVHAVKTTFETSEALLPDSDFDGLPDYAERYMPCKAPPECMLEPGSTTARRCTNTGEVCTANSECTAGLGFCPTNPNRQDTDGDGLSDLDELSEAQLAALASYAELFPGFRLDASLSDKLGTDPSRADTDGDGLSDDFELSTGWVVVRIDGEVTRVLSDPRLRDTDGDELDDGAEYTRRTDPRDADTDDDGRIDGRDTVGSPLRPDISVNVTYTAMQLSNPAPEAPEWMWGFYVQKPGQPFPGTLASNQLNSCPVPPVGNCMCSTERRDFALRKTVALTLAPGEAIVLNGAIMDGYEDPGRTCLNGNTNVYETVPYSDDNHYMNFISEPVTYETLIAGQFTSRTIDLTDIAHSGYGVRIFVHIETNCAGTARRVCRPGSACIANDDCESNACQNGVCANLCGDGTPNEGEVCDDGNTFACGCDVDCLRRGPGCAPGVACVLNQDCASNACDNGVCKGCGNGLTESELGEVCDDGNADGCGTCNATCGAAAAVAGCRSGIGCNDPGVCASGSCENGFCRDVCGNGITETATEKCDDHNDRPCGSCNAACDGTGTGTCAAGIGCNAGTDCTSGTCTNHLCQ